MNENPAAGAHEAITAEAADPDNIFAVHHIGAAGLVGFINEHSTRRASAQGWQSCVDGVGFGVVGLRRISELERLARAWIEDLDVRAFAAAARGVDQFGAPTRVSSAKLDAKTFRAGPRIAYSVYASWVHRRVPGTSDGSDPSGFVPPGTDYFPPRRPCARRQRRSTSTQRIFENWSWFFGFSGSQQTSRVYSHVRTVNLANIPSITVGVPLVIWTPTVMEGIRVCPHAHAGGSGMLLT